MRIAASPRRPLAAAFPAATILAILVLPSGLTGQAPRRQTQADDYTRYELLSPGSAKFRILYEVTATTSGATAFFNPIRRGSVASDEAVSDRMTGAPLAFEVVNGTVARAGGVRGADSTGEYIMVHLARPVPDSGEARIQIDKTYEDATSYLVRGDTIVFTRPLGIKRNAVVLPPGYELLGVNYPSQVRTEPDGRLAVSFINIGPAEVPYTVRARCATTVPDGASCPVPATPAGGGGGAAGSRAASSRSPDASAATPRATPAPGASPRSRASQLAERAHQDREIVYFLQQPETHAFDLYHDYTESRAGVDKYINVVRTGSAVSRPSARILDTGESLPYEILRGAEITAARLDIGEAVTPGTEVVVIRFPAVKDGQSIRLRISETYSDAARYRLDGDELVWDRSFGRPANAMVLPAGWWLTNCSIPATVSMTGDGRVRLDFANPRNDEIAVLVTARRR
jgi:hypothetical protein